MMINTTLAFARDMTFEMNNAFLKDGMLSDRVIMPPPRGFKMGETYTGLD